jgi:DNA-binding MarR family transcriptional regulator
VATRGEIEELMAQWRHVMAASRPHWGSVDLTFTQLRALSTIARRQPLRVSGLAQELGVGLGAASALTDRMVRHGLVSRRPQEGDRRIVLLEVAQRGRKLLDRLEQDRTEHFGKLIERMTPAERDALAVVLRAFVRLSAENTLKRGPHGPVVVQRDVN